MAIYSTFMQRAYDQLIMDVCLQNLPVVFCLDRAGLVGEDGPTHHGVFDLTYLRSIPNLMVLAPPTRPSSRICCTRRSGGGPGRDSLSARCGCWHRDAREPVVWEAAVPRSGHRAPTCALARRTHRAGA